MSHKSWSEVRIKILSAYPPATPQEITKCDSADPDQLASSEANWSVSTLFAKGVYLGSAGQEL